ncbi:hypothetical protein VXQ92_04445 [Acinetobacter sp. 228]|uniref:hypothetical protein n=1 Tax=Acinetobacter sp. 228 TaxID=3114700 RepID=UPI003A865957
MNKNQELERGIIPAGTRISLYEGSIKLLEDVAVKANQEWIIQQSKIEMITAIVWEMLVIIALRVQPISNFFTNIPRGPRIFINFNNK